MLTLTAIVAAWSVLVTRAELQPVLESTRSAFLYVANWHFIAETSGYFATDVDSNPVLHFWSLSIEEQFYVGWPVVLTAILAVARRFTSRPEQAARLIVIGLAIASALWARHLASIDVSRSYYGTDARAYQLLAGAAIALSPELTLRMRARWGRTASSIPIGMLVGLIVLATSAVNVDVVNRGFLVTAVTVALLVALETTQGGVGRRVLASSPAVALGRISYGTYLWHWPVIVIARMETNMSPAAIAVAGAIIATTLAALSARLLELPIRRSTQLNGRHRAVIAASLATSAIAGLVVLPMLARSTDQPTVVASASGGDLELDWQAAKDDRAQRGQCPEDHLKDHLTECHLHEGSGDRVLILGDSQTWSFTPALTDLAASEDWDLWALSRRMQLGAQPHPRAAAAPGPPRGMLRRSRTLVWRLRPRDQSRCGDPRPDRGREPRHEGADSNDRWTLARLGYTGLLANHRGRRRDHSGRSDGRGSASSLSSRGRLPASSRPTPRSASPAR